jgi:hypothetical protein
MAKKTTKIKRGLKEALQQADPEVTQRFVGSPIWNHVPMSDLASPPPVKTPKLEEAFEQINLTMESIANEILVFRANIDVANKKLHGQLQRMVETNQRVNELL